MMRCQLARKHGRAPGEGGAGAGHLCACVRALLLLQWTLGLCFGGNQLLLSMAFWQAASGW